MRGPVDFLKLGDRHMRVNLRRGQVGVTEHSPDEADIGAAFEHQGGHGVAEQMARAALAQISRADPPPRHIREMVGVGGSPALEGNTT